MRQHEQITQRSPAWDAIRLGKVTASRVHSILGTPRARDKAMRELVDEIITGRRAEVFVNDAMRWGTETESQARDAYSARTGVLVDEIGFVTHPTIAQAGCSPDGLIGDRGLVELKCPTSDRHAQFLITKEIPKHYISQVQFQMACCERDWCDWVSFDPRFEPEDQLLIIRVQRDDQFIKDCEQKVRYFLEEVNWRAIIEKEFSNAKF